jgi:hypothetical protein
VNFFGLKLGRRDAGALAPAVPQTSLSPSGHVGHRRDLCWWEPIRSPGMLLEPEPFDWHQDDNSGPTRRFVSGPTLSAAATPGDAYMVVSLTFRQCDFQGAFSPGTIVMFDNCRFIDCDFAYSEWRDTHFRNCSFEGSSISLAQFSRCEFRGCNWKRIGLASKTEMVRTFVDDPRSLITAAISLTNPQDTSLRHRMYQWYRLQGTRAHFLRTLMVSHQASGDEHTYYDTVGLHERQRSFARVAEDLFTIAFGRFVQKLGAILALLFHLADMIIVSSFGWLNRWGESASRPFLALASCFGVFGLVYRFWPFQNSIGTPFQKSFDITLLVGYGNQVAKNDRTLEIVQDGHALVAIVIYSVFFATVISKLSRAR